MPRKLNAMIVCTRPAHLATYLCTCKGVQGSARKGVKGVQGRPSGWGRRRWDVCQADADAIGPHAGPQVRAARETNEVKTCTVPVPRGRTS